VPAGPHHVAGLGLSSADPAWRAAGRDLVQAYATPARAALARDRPGRPRWGADAPADPAPAIVRDAHYATRRRTLAPSGAHVSNPRTTVIVGGTAGIGRRLAQKLADRGDHVVIGGRDAARARAVAAEIGGATRGIGFDLADPASIAPALADVARVDHVVLTAIERDVNSVRDFDIERARRLATIKLVGYVETVHALAPRIAPDGSVVLYGGQARERPYPGSTTVTSVNGAVTSMVRTLALELAPVRVNAIHPGVVGDSPAWAGKAQFLAPTIERTPTRRLATMDDCVGATLFLMENAAVNGINLVVDGGWSVA
jgi:NAD(P)-dependent dehydrogenase (short-subunit alcohol dehydrogenase family)